MLRGRLAALAALFAVGSSGPGAPLTVDSGHGPVPLAESGPGALVRGISWRPGAGGLEWTELELYGRGETRRSILVVARFDPTRFSLSLENGMAPGGLLHVWTLDRAPKGSALAVNAGMFAGDGAWGWVVHAGHEYREPRSGPLARAVVIDTAGRVELMGDDDLARVRAASMGAVREAFQSYPALLSDGVLPELVQNPSDLIDLNHRDTRLALGVDREGKIILALTRFDALGPAFGSVPFGVTLPEMALVMRGLGAVSAVSLDGGISAQLLVRDSAGAEHRWAGLRAVPLGLSARPR